MRTNLLTQQKGFTLIELLAVMAIVATLAGIVSISVGGSGETSRDTQTQQDATTVESAAADFFAAQVGADTLRSKTVTVLGRDNIEQITGSRWPEAYMSIAYAPVFPEDDLTTVASILFLDTDGTLSDLRPRGLLQRFNAIDFNALVGGEFMEAPPDNANRTSNGFSDYLWLFEKSTVAGGSGEGASRKVAVLKLISVENSEISNLVDLTYQRLVGVDFSDELPVASAQTFFTNEDTPTGITLEGIDADTCELTFIIESGPDNGSLTDILNNPCVPGDPNGDSASVIYSPDLNFNGVDNFTYIVIDGNGDDIATITVTIEVVNDPPSFIAGQSLVISDEDVPYSDTWATVINAGPDNEFGQLLTFDVTNNNPPLFSAPPAIAADGTLSYTPAPNARGTAIITVQLQDDAGTDRGGVDTSGPEIFTITINPINDPPVGVVNLTTDGITPVSFTLTGTDVETPGSELIFNIPSPPSTVSRTIPNLTYTPGSGFSGFDSFQYTVTDRGDPDNCALAPCDGPLTGVGTVYINNPSFETGDLSGWNTVIPVGAFASAATSSLVTVRELAEGELLSIQEQEAQDAIEAILESGGDMNAKDGTYFAFLKTNGPGSYTSVYRTVTVSAGTTISGWAFFFDAETASDTNSCFFSDNAQVLIRGGAGILDPILETVFDAAAACSTVAVPPLPQFPGTVPWTPFSYTFLVPGTFTIEARITNTVDSRFDSHMGLDALAIN